MDKRNQPLKAGELYWVYMAGTKKGYTVFSEKLLRIKLADGSIGPDDIVGKRVTISF